jgi:hypothetical protein
MDIADNVLRTDLIALRCMKPEKTSQLRIRLDHSGCAFWDEIVDCIVLLPVNARGGLRLLEVDYVPRTFIMKWSACISGTRNTPEGRGLRSSSAENISLADFEEPDLSHLRTMLRLPRFALEVSTPFPRLSRSTFGGHFMIVAGVFLGRSVLFRLPHLNRVRDFQQFPGICCVSLSFPARAAFRLSSLRQDPVFRQWNRACWLLFAGLRH